MANAIGLLMHLVNPDQLRFLTPVLKELQQIVQLVGDKATEHTLVISPWEHLVYGSTRVATKFPTDEVLAN